MFSNSLGTFGVLTIKSSVQSVYKIGVNASSCPSYFKKINKDALHKCVVKSQKTTIKVVPSRCKKYQESLARCPKISRNLRYYKSLLPKPKSKCKSHTTIDDFQKARQDVMLQANQIMKNFEKECSAILAKLDKDLQTAQNKESVQMQEILKTTQGKLQELISLDARFGTLKRKKALMLNDETRRAFESLHDDDALNIAKIKSDIKSLERDVLICLDHAMGLLLECRNCKSPKELEECTQGNIKDAGNKLDQKIKDIGPRLEVIKKYRDEILKHHNNSRDEIMAIYTEKHTEFLKYLERCIFAIKCGSK